MQDTPHIVAQLDQDGKPLAFLTYGSTGQPCWPGTRALASHFAADEAATEAQQWQDWSAAKGYAYRFAALRLEPGQ